MSRYPDIAPSKDDTFALARRGFTVGKESLGHGAYGVVYKAKHYDQNIAAKSVYIHPSSDILIVVNEMFILKKLSNHPNIVHVIGFYFIASSHLLIFMELISGGTLRVPLKKNDPKGLKEPIVGKFFQQIGNGLLFMHECGFAHRDLKPENIMLTHQKPEKAEAKITDFGISGSFYDEPTGEELMVSEVAGSILYMAPEIVGLTIVKKGHKKNTEHLSQPKSPFVADVFTLGIVLFEMLHGNKVFPNKWPRSKSICFADVYDYWMSFRRGFEYSEKISPECIDLMRGMLEMDLSKRLTMEQVMEHQWAKNPFEFAKQAKDERPKKICCVCV